MKTDNKEKQNRALKSSWVLAMLGLFAIMFVVNYAFFSAAMNTTSGLVTEKYYKYGLQQNKFDKQYRDQKERGWKVALTLAEPWHMGEPTPITLNVLDTYAQAISGGRAEVTAYRPSDAKADVISSFQESTHPGEYIATITLPIQGVWDINILFSKGDEKHMLNQRITILGNGNEAPSTLETIVEFITP